MAQPDQHHKGGGRGGEKRDRGHFNLAAMFSGHQQPTEAFILSTDQSQNQGLFRQPLKPAQQPAVQQQIQQQPIKREKIRVDPTVGKKVDVESENKEPGKEPEVEITDVPKPVEEPRVIQHLPEMTREPPASPQTELKPVKERTLEEKVSVEVVAELKWPNPSEPRHGDRREELQVETKPSVEPDEEKAVDTEEREEGEISDESTDDGQDEPISKRSCPVQSDYPPQRNSRGRLQYGREYLLSFRFLKECKEPPKELMFSDNTLLELIRRSKHDDPSLRRDAFLPPFSQAGVRRQSKDRDRINRGRRSPHPDAVETAAVEKNEPRESENEWERVSEATARSLEDGSEMDELYRKFQIVLDNLTPQKFQKLAKQAKELAEKMDTPEKMSGCIEKIFIKALEEPVCSLVYAKLCLVLTPYKVQVTGEDGQLKMKSFRALLLTKCQQEFEKDKKEDEDLEKLKAAIDSVESEEEKKARKDEYDAAEFKSRHRSLGNIRFIGELFKFKLLSEAIIHECIQRLLKSTSDGESLECFAKLMTTIGKELDHDKGQNLMDRYFARVDHIIEANKIGSRVKFMLQDVVDLRKNTWVPRKIVASNVPTTIDKLHARDDYQSDGRRGVQQPHAPEKLETDRLKRLGNRPQGTVTKRLGPSTWSTKQTQQPQSRSEPQKVESAKYGGRSSKGKKTAGPAPSGSRRSATQLIASEAKKHQKDVIAAVALQTGYKVQPTPVVSDALSEEDVEKKSESQVHSGVSHDKQQEWILRLQCKLSSPEDTNDDVVSFIEKHHSEHCHSPPFIYSLSCALVNAGVSGSGDNVVYKSDLLERRCPVLKHFVDHHSNLQINIIYGLQVTLSKKQHPKGILGKLFTLLYELDVIGEDTFTLWEEGGREDLEGRGVALMSAKPFMEWLRSVTDWQP